MDDQEALTALGAGDPPEKEEAKQWLVDEYYDRLVAALTRHFTIDSDYATIGANDAFIELFEKADSVVPTLDSKSGQPWGWLLLRGIARARDEQRRFFRVLRDVPDAQKDELTRHGADALAEHASDHDPTKQAQDQELSVELRFALFEFIVNHEDELDRQILLHDLVYRHEYLTVEEAEMFDDEFRSRNLGEITTKEGLKKRRQRLHKDKLKAFLTKWGIE